MPRNILLKSLFEIVNKSPGNLPSPAMLDNISSYRSMQDISIKSFQKNLPGEWVLMELSGQKSTLQEAFRYTMKRTCEIWLEHAPCNILYTDPDTLCVKPLLNLEKFKEFRVFTNDPLHSGQYHNCGVRWFPNTTPKCVWDYLDNELKIWNDAAMYDREQTIYKKAMWTQPNLDCTIQQNIVNQIDYYRSWQIRTPEIDFTQPHPILHIHASRNPSSRAAWMQEIWGELNHKGIIS